MNDSIKLDLLLKKLLYGLKQAGRLWSKLLHSRLCEVRNTRRICVYTLRRTQRSSPLKKSTRTISLSQENLGMQWKGIQRDVSTGNLGFESGE